MKFILIASFLTLIINPLFSQDTTGKPSCVSPLQCNVNHSLTYFADADIDSLTYSYADPLTINTKFHDVHYNQDPDCNPVANNCRQDTTQLRYEVYYPDPKKFPYSNNCKLPTILLIHGGGFRDCGGNYYGSQLQLLCRSFAKRGFIAITMDYRLGVLLTPPPNQNSYSVQQMLGIWRAGQDARGCLRSIIKREIAAQEPYRIDTGKIYIGGNSAGSVTAMNVAFYNKSSLLDAVYFGVSNSDVLGSINQNYYYADTTVKYTIKGVLDLWGGVLIPKANLTNPGSFFFVADNPMPPIIAFCGGQDQTFVYTHEDLTFPPLTFQSGKYNSTTFCLNTSSAFTINRANPGPSGYILGSQDIYDMFKVAAKPTEFYLDCDMGHGLESGGADFGITSPTEASLEDYFAARAATFFQAVDNSIYSSLTTTKFVDCENKRIKCSTADAGGCSNSTICPPFP